MGVIMNRFARDFIESELKKQYGEKEYEELKKKMTINKLKLGELLGEQSYVSRGTFGSDDELMMDGHEDLVVANKDGVFSKHSKYGKKGLANLLYEEYYMLFRDGLFGNAIVKKGQIQSVIVEDKYGLYRDLKTLPDKEQDGVLDRVLEVIDVMIEEDVLL